MLSACSMWLTPGRTGCSEFNLISIFVLWEINLWWPNMFQIHPRWTLHSLLHQGFRESSYVNGLNWNIYFRPSDAVSDTRWCQRSPPISRKVNMHFGDKLDRGRSISCHPRGRLKSFSCIARRRIFAWRSLKFLKKIERYYEYFQTSLFVVYNRTFLLVCIFIFKPSIVICCIRWFSSIDKKGINKIMSTKN